MDMASGHGNAAATTSRDAHFFNASTVNLPKDFLFVQYVSFAQKVSFAQTSPATPGLV